MIARISGLSVILLIFHFTTLPAHARSLHSDDDTLKAMRKVYVGGGAGLNYGGYGIQANVLPIPNVRLSVAYGTDLINMNYNLGFNFRLFPYKRICPVISYMYGYNGSIKKDDIINPGLSFNGSSFGAGVEFWNKRKIHFFQFQLLLPIRSLAFEEQSASNQSKWFSKLFNYNPLLLSIGYHFGIRGRK